jgi:hypothetical protein
MSPLKIKSGSTRSKSQPTILTHRRLLRGSTCHPTQIVGFYKGLNGKSVLAIDLVHTDLVLIDLDDVVLRVEKVIVTEPVPVALADISMPIGKIVSTSIENPEPPPPPRSASVSRKTIPNDITGSSQNNRNDCHRAT